MGKDTVVTKVIFRYDPEDDVVFALLPEVPADIQGRYVTSFDWCGHSSADLQMCIQYSTPATEEEYAPLKEIMETNYGYNLKVYKRASYKMRLNLLAELERIDEEKEDEASVLLAGNG